jgi:hypothetical protein
LVPKDWISMDIQFSNLAGLYVIEAGFKELTVPEDAAVSVPTPVEVAVTPTPEVSLTPTQMPFSWEVVVEETFRGNNPRQWEVGQHQSIYGTKTSWIVAAGYEVTLKSEQSWLCITYPMTILETGTQLRIVTEITYPGLGNCGVVFASDRTTFYMFTIEEWGAAFIQRTSSGWVTLEEIRFPLQQGKHEVTIETKANEISFFVDGILMLKAQNPLQKGGEIGLAAGLYNGGQEATFVFHELRVWASN